MDRSAPGPGGRLAQIDVIRGYCIASMVAGHVASGSLLSRGLHAFPAFDGASGFVLLSGLVLGIVQRKRVVADGLAGVQRRTVRRIGVIWTAQVAITLVAIAVVPLARHDHANLPPLTGLGPLEILVRTALLLLAPPVGSVLRLYVVLLALAMLAYVLLARGRWGLVLAGSVALYCVGVLAPRYTSFVAFDGHTRGASWAGWQLLFVSGLLVGWYWRTADVAGLLARHPWAWGGGAAVVVLVTQLTYETFPGVYDKLVFAPGRIVTAWAVVILLYVLLGVLARRVSLGVLRPIERIGQRSLDSYVIQAVMIVLVATVVELDPRGLPAQMFAVLVLLVCWAWAEIRHTRRARAGAARARPPSSGLYDDGVDDGRRSR